MSLSLRSIVVLIPLFIWLSTSLVADRDPRMIRRLINIELEGGTTETKVIASFCNDFPACYRVDWDF